METNESGNTVVYWTAEVEDIEHSDLDTLVLFETEHRARQHAEAVGREWGSVEMLSDSAAAQAIIDEGAAHDEQREHGERARYVTEQVALWIVNDVEHCEHARRFAGRDQASRYSANYRMLREYIEQVTSAPNHGTAAWQVAQELAPNDYGRIDWAVVADELLGE